MKLEIDVMGELRPALAREATLLPRGASAPVTIVKSGRTRGAATVEKLADGRCIVTGFLSDSAGDMSAEFSIEFEAGSMPAFKEEPEPASSDTARAAFWADSPSFTRGTAPLVRPYRESRAASDLRSRAEKAMIQWARKHGVQVPGVDD